MNIDLLIPEDYFSGEQIDRLMVLFGVRNDDELENSIRNVVLASLKEYTEMFLGMGLPSRADEIRQHRLFFLIKHLFRNRIPSEAEVSSYFQLTQTKSRGLIEQTITRFHYDLDEQVMNTLRNALSEARFDANQHRYTVVIQSDIVLDRLNLIVSRNAPMLDPIKKERNMARTYIVSEDTYDVLH